jgi:class 3 adenylate cyclase
MECGARLNAGCPNCGAANPSGAKFCGECGTTLVSGLAPRVATDEPASSASPTAERRLVTVLFADLVGSTALAQDEDPEDTREFLTAYFDLARTIVERYGGTIEKFIGDAVMAVWGTPTAHEDDAERAVRAALEIVGGVPALGDGRGVQARAGVLTGQAAVTIGASGQGMVAGDLVNTASRLQSASRRQASSCSRAGRRRLLPGGQRPSWACAEAPTAARRSSLPSPVATTS